MVKEILWKEWDPIDLNENENLHDEYDSYIGTIISILNSNNKKEKISKYLNKIELEMLGSIKSEEKNNKIAREIEKKYLSIIDES